MQYTATALLFVLMSGSMADAQTVYHVDDDAPPGGDGLSWATAYDTLPPALETARRGDQIWVAAGSYVGNFKLAPGVALYGGFAGTETVLEQRDWTTNETTLDGNQTGRVVTCLEGASEATRIDGFTIIGGYAYDGGGVYAHDASPTIANCVITGNRAYPGRGGGLYLAESAATILHNTITFNYAVRGGGMGLLNSSPTIAKNTITSNSAEYGGGLYVSSSSDPVLADNRILGNSASFGGGILVYESSPTIMNSTIAGNSARQLGGGLDLAWASPTIANCTVTDNSATSQGGGIYLTYSFPIIVNATITRNSTGDGGAVHLSQSLPTLANTVIAFNTSGVRASNGAPVMRYNCVYGNDEYDFSGFDDPTGTDGNISADPQLADLRYGNVHIQPGSPCVDTGNTADALGDSDIDGEARVSPPGGEVDIGADESDGGVWPEGPYGIIRVSSDGHDASDGSSWESAKLTVQAGIDAASALGGEVWVRAGRYVECIKLHPYAYLYGGFDGTESERDQRDWTANTTILDASRQGTVVTVSAGTAVSAIDGFTITGGGTEHGGRDGGGLHVSESSPTIANNIITGNRAYIANGGGLYLFRSSATILKNRITLNEAYESGGGLHLDTSSPMIANNTIVANTAVGDGGGVCLLRSAPTIVNNVISGNCAEQYWGGGMYIYDSSPMIVNNTVAANSAGQGGGLLLNHATPSVLNTVFAFNSSGIHAYNSEPTLRHNCVYGNTTYDFEGLSDPTGVDGNISADPRFADLRYGNIHLQPGSPCIGAGDATAASGDYDIDGDPRVLPAGGVVDIGADESDGDVWPEGPYVVVRVSPDGNDNYDGSSWGQAKRSVQSAIDATVARGGDVWVRAGAYDGCVLLHPYVHLYGGFAGEETRREQRDWTVNTTTLNGQRQGTVVRALAGDGVGCVDGFTITGGASGYYYYGGGVYISRCSRAIVNNTITGNHAQHGGAAYLQTSSSPLINNALIGNSAERDGGGLYLHASSSEIVDSRITGNRSHYRGGGIYLSSSEATIEGSVVSGNSVASGYGGGIFVSQRSPTIVENVIADNDALYGGGLALDDTTAAVVGNLISGNNGGGLHLYQSSPSIVNNVIVGNSVVGNGGGLHLYQSSPDIMNNTVAGNFAGFLGGGLYVGYSTPTIVNNTVTGNSATDGGGVYVGYASPVIANTIVVFNSSGLFRSGGAPTLLHDCVYANTGYDYLGFAADPTGVSGNVAVDPLFVVTPDPGLDGLWGTDDDDYGDLHLLLDSPVIDAGDNAAVPADEFDLDGDGDVDEPMPFDLDGFDRFMDDPLTPDTGAGTAPIVDIGAYEFGPDDCRHGGGLDHDGDVDLLNYVAFERCVTGPEAAPTSGCVCFDLDGSGQVDLADVAEFQTLYTGE